jgi:hypothetical protein
MHRKTLANNAIRIKLIAAAGKTHVRSAEESAVRWLPRDRISRQIPPATQGSKVL